MSMYCHLPGCETTEYDDEEFMCPVHNVDLVPDPSRSRDGRATPPPVPDPGPATAGTAVAGPAAPSSGREWRTTTCWSCGFASPNPDNTCCLECPESLIPPRLLLTWDTGTVRLAPGDAVQLGREGQYAQLFRDYGNVSRRHAMVGVDQDGRAWIEPLLPVNGIFRPADTNDELLRGQRYELRDGETLRFARNVKATVAVYALPGT